MGTRLANDTKSAKKGGGGERQFNGLLDVYKKTIASDGIAGLYRGFVIACVGIIVYRGCYFGFYDTLKPILLGDDAGVVLSFVLGYGVTVAAGLCSYPIDTVRRRMMMTSGEAVKYSGSLDCTVQVLRNEGITSFYKGAGANILRGMAGAGVLAGFDKFKQLYINLKDGGQEEEKVAVAPVEVAAVPVEVIEAPPAEVTEAPAEAEAGAGEGAE